MATGKINRIYWERGVITYVTNSVVTSTSLGRCDITKWGQIVVLKLNLDVGSSTTTSNFIQIGILPWEGTCLACLPIQDDPTGRTATIQITNNQLKLYKSNSGTGFVRANIPYIM